MRLRCGKIFYLFSFAFILMSSSVCFGAQEAKKYLREGNVLYQKGKMDEALEKYNEAGVSMPDSDIINFNRGAALYKKQDYDKAAEAFTKSLTSEDRKIEGDVLYNLGNCKYKSSKLKENTDLQSAVSLMRESLDYYKRAIETDQKNKDARFNREVAEKELKALLEKLKQQPPSPQNRQGQEGQKQEQQRQQQGQGMSSEEKESRGSSAQEKEGQDRQQKEQGVEQKQENAGSAQAQEQEEEKAPAPAQEGEKKELSKEEARMLLERYGKEEGTPDYLNRRNRGYDGKVSKDW